MTMPSLRKDVNEYDLYVFDLDGTLYDQPKLRLTMAMRLMGYYALHPFKAKDLMILQHFRKVKDSWTDSSSEEDIIRKVSEDKKSDVKHVSDTVRRWIYDDPLKILERSKDKRLIGWIDKLRAEGKKVFILSDYPAKDKLRALCVSVDGMYDPDDKRIDALKPSPKGLEVIMSDTGSSPEDILMIGDRQEKDGMCALAAGVDCLILPRKIKNRDYEKFEY